MTNFTFRIVSPDADTFSMNSGKMIILIFFFNHGKIQNHLRMYGTLAIVLEHSSHRSKPNFAKNGEIVCLLAERLFR